MRVFLSLPMTGKTEEEVRNQIQEMKVFAVEQLGILNAIFVHNYDYIPDITDGQYYVITNRAKSVNRLGHAIQEMGTCNLVIFAPYWDESKGCRLEMNICRSYDIPYIDMPEKERPWNTADKAI